MKAKLSPFQRFSDQPINFKKNWPADFNWRLSLLPVLVGVMFLILILRLFQLTIVKGSYFRHLSENNRLRQIEIEPRRGKILDRKGFIIASSQPKDKTSQRIYHEGEKIAHLIGYRQLASKEDFKNDLCPNRLKLNDKIGKEGVEKIFDCQLRGKKGKKLIEVDASGKYLKTISLIPAKEGKTIQLSVDWELTKKSFELIKDKKGAIVATKPQTGEVLVLVSSPSFDPQDFEDNHQSVISRYLKDKNQPLFNRATKGTYPPGSTIKPLIAAAGLEEKVIDEHFQIEDTGVIKAGPLTFGNWYFLEYGKTEGLVDVVKAIRRSNDIFFYKTGERLGEKKIKTWLEKFGWGKPSGIGLDEEEGLIPSSFWKQETIGERWYLGDTYNLSIGQGYILVTPLQVNLATAVFANGGYLCQPRLLKVKNGQQTNCQKLPLSSKTLRLIREGMKQACSPGGTGWPLFNFSIRTVLKKDSPSKGLSLVQTGCKTGTAESYGKNKAPHAWFTVFAPFDKPEIVLTVLVENGGQGSDVAAPIAKEILKSYFERTQ